MSLTPRAGDLRAKVTFQRRGPSANVGGVTRAAWVDLFTRSAELLPVRGGEEVIAGRLAGTSAHTLRVISDSETRTVTTADRVQVDVRDSRPVDAADPRRFLNIRFGPEDLDGRGRWLLLQLDAGVAT